MTQSIFAIALLSIGAIVAAYIYIIMISRASNYVGKKKDYYKSACYTLFMVFIFIETLVLHRIIKYGNLTNHWLLLIGLPFVFGYGFLFLNIKKLMKLYKL